MVEPRRIELTSVRFDDRVEALVLSVLRSGQISQGPMVEALEGAVASIVGVRHAVAVSNGTTSLIAALHVLGVGPGDEVITSPFTFVATLNAILAVGATARFADIDLDTFTVRPDSVDALVNSRTRAVMPVHLYGHPADMTAISAIAARHGLAIVEDAAQALGGSHAGRPVGGFGVGSFSFYATKNITTGEGGMLTTDDDSIATSLRLFRNQGMLEPYRYEMLGQNLRLTDLQAAVGVPQLDDLETITARRSSNAARLSTGLSGLVGIVAPKVRPGDRHVFHQYTIRVEDRCTVGRDDLQHALSAAGVRSAVYYRSLVFDHPCFHEHPAVILDPCPVAASATTQVLSVPVHQHLTSSDVDGIVAAVRDTVT